MSKTAADLRGAVNQAAGFRALNLMRSHQETKTNAKIRWTSWHPPNDPNGKGVWGIECRYWVSGHFHASVEVDRDGRRHLSVGHDEREPTLNEVRVARLELCPEAEYMFLSFHNAAGQVPDGPAVVSLVEFRDDDGQPSELWTPKQR